MPDYFDLSELRALPQMADAVKYPDARCEAAAAHIVAIIEGEVGTSFVPRQVTETLDGGGDAVVLGHGFVLEVQSATENGVAVTDRLTARGGLLRRFAAGSYTPGCWSSGVGNVEVTYLAGYTSEPPADVKEAALRGTRAYLVSTHSSSVMDDRRTSLSTEQGTVQFTVAGRDHPTGYPEVDAVIVAWRDQLDVFGFA